jgi:hypothetical protein
MSMMLAICSPTLSAGIEQTRPTSRLVNGWVTATAYRLEVSQLVIRLRRATSLAVLVMDDQPAALAHMATADGTSVVIAFERSFPLALEMAGLTTRLGRAISQDLAQVLLLAGLVPLAIGFDPLLVIATDAQASSTVLGPGPTAGSTLEPYRTLPTNLSHYLLLCYL